MSHYYSLTCRTCGTSTESYNRANAELIAAAKTAPLVAALEACGAWDLQGLDTSDGSRRGVASFIAQHAKCDAFWVESEYGEANYPSVRVPVMAPTALESAAVDVHQQATANAVARWLEGHGIVFRGVAEDIRAGKWKVSA